MSIMYGEEVKKLYEEICEEFEYLDNDTFQRLKEKAVSLINEEGYPIRYVVGLIWDLWQNYELSDEQESELYALVDKNEQFNDCSDYYEEWSGEYGIDSENPLQLFIDESRKD